MTKLLEFRENLKLILNRYEAFIIPIGKFLLAFFVLSVINGQMGYMNRLDNVALVLIVALTCSFLPLGVQIFFGAVFSLVHMYALSIEVALVGLCMYLLIFVLFFRFRPKDSVVVLLTPLLFYLKIPYVMPIAMGLLGGPGAAVSVSCGVVVYYLNYSVVNNATTISTMGGDEAVAKIRLIIDSAVANKEMLVVVVAFAVTTLTVYFLRRLAMEYSWTIAIVSGAMLNLVILMLGDLVYDINISVIGAILGGIVAMAVGKVIEFFRFCVDYRRTEKVQFEDDEYFYYVTAVPKMTVAAPAKTIKRINSTNAPTRSVTTERTIGGQGRSRYSSGGEQAVGGNNVRSSAYNRSGERLVTGRSVTINGQMTSSRRTIGDGGVDDYEEIF